MDDVAVASGVAPVGITPYRRTVVQLRLEDMPADEMPLVMDMQGGFYFKPEGQGRIWLTPHDEVASPPCDAAPEELAVAQAIVRADIAALVDRSTDTLSGGEWQRVRIARALAQGGQAIVLDEPTTYLDIAHEMAVFELCDGLARQGLCVILVSHQLNLVARFADQIVLLHQGCVAAEGSPNEVMRGDVLERVYEWPLIVSRDPAVGAPVLLPLRHRGSR